MDSHLHAFAPPACSVAEIDAELHAIKEAFLRLNDTDSGRALEIAVRFGELVTMKRQYAATNPK